MGIFNLKEVQIQRDSTSILSKKGWISHAVANELLNMICLKVHFSPKW